MVSVNQSSDPLDPLHEHSFLSLFPRTIKASTGGSIRGDLNNLESIHDFMKSVGLRGADKLLDKAKTIVDGGSEFLNSNFVIFEASMGSNDANATKDKEKAQERRPGLGRKRARFSFKPTSRQPASSLLPTLDIDQLHDPEEFFLAYERRENAKKEIERQRGGSLTVLNEFNPSINERRRRPGILGNHKKSVTYKHRYSSMPTENDPSVSSKEKLEQDVSSPADYEMKIQTTAPVVEAEEMEIAESIAQSEDKVKVLLDELLSSNSEDLDGDGALTLLQKHLQIKSFDLNKLCLPDFRDIESTDFTNLRENLPNSHNRLRNMHDLLKGMSSKTPFKHNQAVESPIHLLASPTPPKSPFASLSLLRKQTFQSNPSKDPFSPVNIDALGVRNPAEQIDEHLDQGDLEKELGISGKLKSVVGDEITKTTEANMGSKEVIDPFSPLNIDLSPTRSPAAEQVDKHLDQGDFEKGLDAASKLKSLAGVEITKSTAANMGSKEVIDSFSTCNVDLPPARSPAAEQNNKQLGQGDLEEELDISGKLKSLVGDEITKSTAANPDLKGVIVGDSDHLLDKSLTDYLSQQSVGIDVRPSEMCADLDDHHWRNVMNERNMGQHVEDMSQQAARSAQPDNDIENSTRTHTDFDTHMYNTTEREENVEDVRQKAVSSVLVDINAEDLTTENLSSSQRELNQTNIAPPEDHISDAPSTSSEIGPEKQIKKRPRKSLYGQGKENKPSCKGKQGKALSHRHSLADAGTSWETGLRRSSRNRMRPLEYWKGERFLYGRVHGSLTTVIGVKYMSPAKDDGKPAFKVKSFVSNKYKELVELAALH